MNCGSITTENNTNVDDIESIIHIPRNLFKDQPLMETVILNMVKTPIQNQKEMDKFIRKEQKNLFCKNHGASNGLNSLGTDRSLRLCLLPNSHVAVGIREYREAA